jgi:N-acetylglutamate synthase-like GNAT family acetyltransferase
MLCNGKDGSDVSWTSATWFLSPPAVVTAVMPRDRQSELSAKEPATRAEWDSYFYLRWRILRKPWEQPRGSEQDALDGKSFHLMIQDAADAVAVGRLHLNSAEEAQVRYMAVDPAHQGSGLGRKILQGLENRAWAQGVKRIVLNSRTGAVGFYTRQGYEAIGPGETLFGEVQHTRMRKNLGPNSAEKKSK